MRRYFRRWHLQHEVPWTLAGERYPATPPLAATWCAQ